MKSTIALNKWYTINNFNKCQQHLSKLVISQWYQDHTWGLMPPNQTILGVEFFEIEYFPLIQHVFPLILPCRNVKLRSKNDVSEGDTSIQEYRVGTWYSNQRIPCWNVTLWSKNTVSERDTPIQKYRVRMLHSNLRIPCRNVTLRSKIHFFIFQPKSYVRFPHSTFPFSHLISLILNMVWSQVQSPYFSWFFHSIKFSFH